MDNKDNRVESRNITVPYTSDRFRPYMTILNDEGLGHHNLVQWAHVYSARTYKVSLADTAFQYSAEWEKEFEVLSQMDLGDIPYLVHETLRDIYYGLTSLQHLIGNGLTTEVIGNHLNVSSLVHCSYSSYALGIPREVCTIVFGRTTGVVEVVEEIGLVLTMHSSSSPRILEETAESRTVAGGCYSAHWVTRADALRLIVPVNSLLVRWGHIVLLGALARNHLYKPDGRCSIGIHIHKPVYYSGRSIDDVHVHVHGFPAVAETAHVKNADVQLVLLHGSLIRTLIKLDVIQGSLKHERILEDFGVMRDNYEKPPSVEQDEFLDNQVMEHRSGH